MVDFLSPGRNHQSHLLSTRLLAIHGPWQSREWGM